MTRIVAAAAAMAMVLVGGCSKFSLEAGEPEIALSQASLDFGSVERGYWREMSLAVFNEGNATLNVDDYVLQDGSSDAFYFADPDKVIGPGDYAELLVRYTPTHEGGDSGAVLIYSDDEDEEEVIIFLQGGGVVPGCELDPELLYFPTDVGEQTLSFMVRSVGSGPLTIEAVALEDGEEAFTVEFPAGYDPPTSIDAGTSLDVSVHYAPDDELARQDRVLLFTSDPELEGGIAAVELIAAGEPPDGENQPPLVQILTPPNGTVSLLATNLVFTGLVADLEEAPDQLGILWHSDIDGYLPTAPADGNGAVGMETADLTAGEHLVTLMAFDAEGEQGSDTITVLIYEEDDELEYVISGGDTPYHYFHVDDDITIELNGNAIFVDVDGTQDHHPPLSFFASVGDVLHITGVDQQFCTQALDALFLHVSTVIEQPLSPAFSVSGCEEHDDYDPNYQGPWPVTFLDDTYTISIP